MARGRAHGFTLVEVLAACTVAGVLASLAVPSWRDHILKARRADGIAALMQLQAAQERMRQAHGLYSADFAALQRPAASLEGLYALAVEVTGPDQYRATATPLGDQRNDTACPQLVLEVASGFAQHGPSARCWNR